MRTPFEAAADKRFYALCRASDETKATVSAEAAKLTKALAEAQQRHEKTRQADVQDAIKVLSRQHANREWRPHGSSGARSDKETESLANRRVDGANAAEISGLYNDFVEKTNQQLGLQNEQAAEKEQGINWTEEMMAEYAKAKEEEAYKSLADELDKEQGSGTEEGSENDQGAGLIWSDEMLKEYQKAKEGEPYHSMADELDRTKD